MKRNKKIFVSVFLAISMVLCCFASAANAEDAELQFTDAGISDYGGVYTDFEETNSEAIPLGGKVGVRLSAIEAAIGESLILTVSLDNAVGVAALNIFINFDTQKLEFVKTIGESDEYSPMAVGGVTCDDASVLGIGAIWLEHCLSENIDIISFEFTVKESGYANFKLADGNGIWDYNDARIGFEGNNLQIYNNV